MQDSLLYNEHAFLDPPLFLLKFRATLYKGISM